MPMSSLKNFERGGGNGEKGANTCAGSTLKVTVVDVGLGAGKTTSIETVPVTFLVSARAHVSNI